MKVDTSPEIIHQDVMGLEEPDIVHVTGKADYIGILTMYDYIHTATYLL